MSNPIQNINEIKPAADKAGDKAQKDPVQKEYLEGKALLERGETGLAAVSLHNALLGYEEKNDETGIANAANQLGHVCLARKEYDKAISHYLRAEEICKKLGDPQSLIALAKQLTTVYTESGMYRDAIDRCLQVLDEYHANNDPKGSVGVLETMAEIYVKAGDKGKAADAYKTVASIHKNFKHDSMAESYLQKAADLEG